MEVAGLIWWKAFQAERSGQAKRHKAWNMGGFSNQRRGLNEQQMLVTEIWGLIATSRLQRLHLGPIEYKSCESRAKSLSQCFPNSQRLKSLESLVLSAIATDRKKNRTGLTVVLQNDAKCHFMLFGNKSSGISVNIGTSCIEQSDKEKLLGITLDKNLDFKCHVENICKKAGQKLHALARVAKFMDQEKLQTVMNAFILSQFSYCPVIWMFHDRNVNNKINKIHERALRIAFKDTSSNFEELLIKAASVTIHQRNLQLLTTEIYKTKHDLNPKFMGKIFVEKNISYSLRCNDHLSVPIPRTNAYGIETIRYTGHKLWQSLPLEIKESRTLTEFKRKIKKHHFSHCNCRLCKTYVNNLGFL